MCIGQSRWCGTRTIHQPPLRKEVRDYFSDHFKSVYLNRTKIENLNFQSIGVQETIMMERPFFIDEVKQGVWDCDSVKSLGPNNVNFGFIEKFLRDLCKSYMWMVN